jgi:hypothetical protein
MRSLRNTATFAGTVRARWNSPNRWEALRE